jgi:hypothetical protein
VKRPNIVFAWVKHISHCPRVFESVYRVPMRHLCFREVCVDLRQYFQSMQLTVLCSDDELVYVARRVALRRRAGLPETNSLVFRVTV